MSERHTHDAMPRGKASNFELQRAVILQAAAELFAERGFRGASMAQLARACRVSKPLLYHYYRDKEHILLDIADSFRDLARRFKDEE